MPDEALQTARPAYIVLKNAGIDGLRQPHPSIRPSAQASRPCSRAIAAERRDQRFRANHTGAPHSVLYLDTLTDAAFGAEYTKDADR